MITIMLLVWSALYLVALNATRSHAQNLFALDPPHRAVPADRPSVQEFARRPIGWSVDAYSQTVAGSSNTSKTRQIQHRRGLP